MRLPMMPKPINPIFISVSFLGCCYQSRFVDGFAFDLGDFFVGKTKVSRTDISFDLLGVARADDGASHSRIVQRPCDSDLARRPFVAFADFPQALDESEVLRELRLMKLEIATAPIAVR